MNFKDLVERIQSNFSIEKSFYDREVVGIDKSTRKTVPYIYTPNAYENEFNDWLSKVQDEHTKLFYNRRGQAVPKYDNKGKPIEGTDNTKDLEPDFKITQIIRYLANDGNEYLHTQGLLTAYTQQENIRTVHFTDPEEWQETEFNRDRRRILDRDVNVCLGPSGHIKHHTLDYNDSNLEELKKHTEPGFAMSLKRESDNGVRGITNWDDFKNKPFNYLYNAEWQTPEQKAESRKKSEQLEAQIIQENVKTIKR